MWASLPLAASVFALVLGVTVTPVGTSDDGAQLFARNCAMCHGAHGAGDGPAAATMNPRPADLTSAEFQDARTDEQLVAAITDGKGTMLGYKDRLSGEQITLLVTYIRTLRAETR